MGNLFGAQTNNRGENICFTCSCSRSFKADNERWEQTEQTARKTGERAGERKEAVKADGFVRQNSTLLFVNNRNPDQWLNTCEPQFPYLEKKKRKENLKKFSHGWGGSELLLWRARLAIHHHPGSFVTR